jgi:murein DD-endopeptidase MepM/ murein hydrolase activator NlpD
VVAPFIEPTCPYCAGHRGLRYHTGAGAPVSAAAAGTVSFAGAVAGVRYVVVAHPGGWRTTYGRLLGLAVRAGARVEEGEVVGTAAGTLHFGLRQGTVYVDPAPLLAVARSPVRLVPADGRPARAQRSGASRCPAFRAGVASPGRR